MTPDWNALSAIGTLLAVLVALFQLPASRWWNAPKLRFGWRSIDQEVKMVGGHTRVCRNLRLRVVNKGREAAQRVEVVLTDLFQINEANGSYSLVAGFVPTPLKWTHSHHSICEYLASGEKLCDLGVQENFDPQTGDDEFTFATAVIPQRGYHHIRTGLYVMRMVITALNCRPAVLILGMRIGGPIPLIINVANAKIRRKIVQIDKSYSELIKN